MADISLPTPGQKPWSLNPAITAMNSELNGRLGDQQLRNTVTSIIQETVPPVPPGVITSSSVSRIIAVAEGAALPTLSPGDMVVRYAIPGATYYTDFSSDTVGAPPSGWTVAWDNTAWTIESEATAAGGKALRVAPSGAGRYGLTWNAVSGDADRGNVEILMRFRSASDASSGITGAARVGGTDVSETGYRGGQNSASVVSLSKYDAGAFTSLSTATRSFAATTWYRSRFRVEGTTLRLKVWPDTDTEPASWDITTTDTSISGPGLVGVAATTNNAKLVDWIAVATGGKTAVKP